MFKENRLAYAKKKSPTKKINKKAAAWNKSLKAANPSGGNTNVPSSTSSKSSISYTAGDRMKAKNKAIHNTLIAKGIDPTKATAQDISSAEAGLATTGFDVTNKAGDTYTFTGASTGSQGFGQPGVKKKVTDLPTPTPETGKEDTMTTSYSDSNSGFQDSFNSSLDLWNKLLGTAQDEYKNRFNELQQEMGERGKTYASTLEAAYAPTYQRLQSEADQSYKQQKFASAAGGALWGSRTMDYMAQIDDKTRMAREATDALKMAEQMKYQAALEGATDQQLQAYNNRITDLTSAKDKAMTDLDLVKKGLNEDLLNQQNQIRQELAAYHQAMGNAYNPQTGEVTPSPAYEAAMNEAIAQAALTDANAKKVAYDMQNPDLDIQYIDRGNGDVTVITTNPKTGTMNTTTLKGVGAVPKASSTGDGTGIDSALGFNPELADEYRYYKQLLQDDVEAANRYIRGKDASFATQANKWQVANAALEASMGGDSSVETTSGGDSILSGLNPGYTISQLWNELNKSK